MSRLSSAGASQGRANDREEAERRAIRENTLRMALTSEARQRLTNVRMVKPELAGAIEEYIIQLVQAGRLKRTVDDEQLKQMLLQLQEKKRDFTIRRI
jgi:programmed cell death protein 5